MKKLLTLITFALVAFMVDAQSTQKGDINGDGDISVNDVAMIVNYILGVGNNGFIAANADINGDGEIDINDVMSAVNIILNDNDPDNPNTVVHQIILAVGQQKTIENTYDNSTVYTVDVSDPSIATAEIFNNTIIVTGVSEGFTRLFIIDNSRGALVQDYEVYVYLYCPDDHHPHMIDLGLPSGILWACCNVGATSPEGYGGYYAWGETWEKDMYSIMTYYYRDNGEYNYLGDNIAGSQYDVAHVTWGGSWVMPSKTQLEELRDNCIYTWTTKNGVEGGEFKGPNGERIFLPKSGHRYYEYFIDFNSFYWSSTANPSPSVGSQRLEIYQSGAGVNGGQRIRGCTVRPVAR